MKTLTVFALLTVMGMFLVTSLSLTGSPPSSILPLPLIASLTNRVPMPVSPAPIIFLDDGSLYKTQGKPGNAPPLKPGVYQTRPYDIVLIVPESGLDDGCVNGGINSNSKMPVINPNLQAVPVSPAR
jgi:hypothetical protein